MSERTTQEPQRFWLYSVPHVLEAHLGMLEGVVGRVAGGGEMRSTGYVATVRDDDGRSRDRLTELGERTLWHAARLAVDASEAMYAMEGQSTGSRDDPHRAVLEDLLYDGARALSVLAAALLGAREYPDPCHVTWGVERMVRDLLGRVRSDTVQEATKAVEREEHGLALEELEVPAGKERKAQAKGEDRGTKAAEVSPGNLPEQTIGHGDVRDVQEEVPSADRVYFELVNAVRPLWLALFALEYSEEVLTDSPLHDGPAPEWWESTRELAQYAQRARDVREEMAVALGTLPEPLEEFLTHARRVLVPAAATLSMMFGHVHDVDMNDYRDVLGELYDQVDGLYRHALRIHQAVGAAEEVAHV